MHFFFLTHHIFVHDIRIKWQDSVTLLQVYTTLYSISSIYSLLLLLADALETRLKNAKEVNIYRYPEQGHAFLNADTWGVNVRKELGFLEKDKDAIVEEKDIRDQAWGRIFNFFTKHLSS